MEVRKAVIKVIAASLLFIASSDAKATLTLRKVQVTDGARIDLLFDSKISGSQVKTEFFKDIVQISLSDTSVYPAKMVSVAGTHLSKIFAYQFSPKLVRCRITVKGKAEDFKNRIQVKPNGKTVTVRVVGPAHEEQVAASEQNKQETKNEISAEEKQLLDRVVNSQAAPIPAKEVVKTSESTETRKIKQPLVSGKPMPSVLRSFGMLIIVLSLFGIFVLIMKKVKGPKLESHKGFSGFMGKFAKFGLGGKGKMIEVVANHYLGPKKNIAVVRVAGRLLVLGVTNESINLITQLAGNQIPQDSQDLSGNYIASAFAGLDATGDFEEPKLTPAPSPVPFAEVLKTENTRPSVRAQIKSRLEGMKQL